MKMMGCLAGTLLYACGLTPAFAVESEGERRLQRPPGEVQLDRPQGEVRPRPHREVQPKDFRSGKPRRPKDARRPGREVPRPGSTAARPVP